MFRLMAAPLGALALVLPTLASAQERDPWESLTFERLADVAETALTKAQDLSLKNNREYCGYLAFDGDDKLRFTDPLKGDVESCEPPYVDDDWELIASYHTHGAIDPNETDVTFELPSTGDLESDMDEGVDGFLSTPGGRFWFIDTIDEVVIMLGDIGYFKKDRNFERDWGCEPLDEHTFDEIYIMEEEEIGPCDL